MARSKIVITFPQTFLADQNNVLFKSSINSVFTPYKVSWLDSINSSSLLTLREEIQTATAALFSYPFYDAINYVNSINNLDFPNYFSVTRVDNVVTILSNVDGLTFSNESSNNTGVLFTITNETGTLSDFEITNTTIISGDCDNVAIEVTTNTQASDLILPYATALTTNPFTFSYSRGQNLAIKVKNTLDQIAKDLILTPNKLIAGNIDVSVISTPTTNTATVNYNSLLNTGNLTLQYSIDGINYSSVNVFELSEGTHTAYIKDQFDCVVEKEFVVVNSFVKKPYPVISKINSIRYALQEEWNGKTILKNDENTLSNEVLDAIQHLDCQRFQTDDVITTQILTNYDTIDAVLIEESGETPLTVVEKRTYLNVKDYRDCVVYSKGNGQAGIYFTEGNLYNYTTGLVEGDHTLNGSVPNWMRVGSFIELDGIGQLEIKKSIYDDDLDKNVIVVDYNFTATPILSKVKSIYDKQPYNGYEFDADFSAYEDKCLRIKITLTDDDLPTLTFLSEILDIKDIHEDCFKIDYWSDRNSDNMLYETGIKHRLRMPFTSITDDPNSSIDIHKGDTRVTVTEADYFEGDKIVFKPCSKEISKKLELALLHRFLSINNIPYKSSDKPEKEKQADSNLYVVTANLIKDGVGYTDNDAYYNITQTDVIDIPALIDYGDGFISY